MKFTLNLWAFAVLICVGTALNVQEGRSECTCYTATVSPSTCKPITSKHGQGCTTPDCVYLSTTLVPPSNANCPSTPTSVLPCPTKCPIGCATSTTSITGCYTATKTTGTIACPIETKCVPKPCVTTVTETIPPKRCGCPTTKTKKVPPTCFSCPKKSECITRTKTVSGSS